MGYMAKLSRSKSLRKRVLSKSLRKRFRKSLKKTGKRRYNKSYRRRITRKNRRYRKRNYRGGFFSSEALNTHVENFTPLCNINCAHSDLSADNAASTDLDCAFNAHGGCGKTEHDIRTSKEIGQARQTLGEKVV